MAKYICYNYDQLAMVVVNFKEQLRLGTFENAVHYLVDYKLDLSCFNSSFKNDYQGCSAYDSALLLKIFLIAYSRGTSSREGEFTNMIPL